ncbi:hypothetical protein [Kitasatospora sp. NPDC048407]|uniref:hypothetical protein n=1 Tax=Kitasatospora sp. NPDC048407 TaxID=3364051 RepID=UPI0037133F9D
MHSTADVPNPQTPPPPASVVVSVSPELASALTALGPRGERALGLLREAEAVLADPQRHHVPYEVAPMCCRGALESLLGLAGRDQDFVGPVSTGNEVIARAKDIVDAHAAGTLTAEALAVLATAVEARRAEEANPGGHRIRKLEQLVLDQTRQEMGAPEREAVRRSWNTLYSDASAILHGSEDREGDESTEDRAHRLLRETLAAVEELFLGLPGRAEHLRDLAATAEPTADQIAEVERFTDPRSGGYFFRAATGRRWLEKLSDHRLLPDGHTWPALPYLRRLAAGDPALILGWLEQNLPALTGRGPQAVGMAVILAADTGIQAAPWMAKAARVYPEADVQLRIAYWALRVPDADRGQPWVLAVEAVLKTAPFTRRESWHTCRLLEALTATAHPGGTPRAAGDRLAGLIRAVLAGVLADHLTHVPDVAVDLTADLRQVSLTDPPYERAVAVIRALLDLAREDARLDLTLQTRTRFLLTKVPEGRVRDRILAVHLLESHPHDGQDPAGETAKAWWAEAITLAPRLVAASRPHADTADLLAHLHTTCPAHRRDELENALTLGLGPAPEPADIDRWRHAHTTVGEALSDGWRTARALAPVLPAPVLKQWRPLLDTLDEIAGGPAPERPEPMVTVSTHIHGPRGLAAAPFAELAALSGPAAALRELQTTPQPADALLPQAEDRAAVLGELVTAQPALWAADAATLTTTAADDVLRTAYFNAVHRAFQQGALTDPHLLAHATTIAFAHRPADDATHDGAETLCRVITNLLHLCWNQAADVTAVETEAVNWLDHLVATWTKPRTTAEEPFITALSAAGGSALLALITWGCARINRAGGGLPQPLTTRLAALLEAGSDDQALAIIGFCLAHLDRADPAFTAAHAEPLYTLDQPASPAHSWLVRGLPSAAIAARLDRAHLLSILCRPGQDRAIDKVVNALLDPAQPLGPLGSLLEELAALQGGTTAVSELLSRLALATTHAPDDSPWPARATTLWEQALAADLPPAALYGLGRFVFATAIDDPTWLRLTARTVERHGDLECTTSIARRAAQHPTSPAALQVMARILAAADPSSAETIRPEAVTLFNASRDTTYPERELLREALINAGQVEAAFDSPIP